MAQSAHNWQSQYATAWLDAALAAVRYLADGGLNRIPVVKGRVGKIEPHLLVRGELYLRTKRLIASLFKQL